MRDFACIPSISSGVPNVRNTIDLSELFEDGRHFSKVFLFVWTAMD